MKIAFMGAGLMGSGFVRRLLAKGHEVHVWNRNPARTAPLVAEGARGEGALDSSAAMRWPVK